MSPFKASVRSFSMFLLACHFSTNLLVDGPKVFADSIRDLSPSNLTNLGGKNCLQLAMQIDFRVWIAATIIGIEVCAFPTQKKSKTEIIPLLFLSLLSKPVMSTVTAYLKRKIHNEWKKVEHAVKWTLREILWDYGWWLVSQRGFVGWVVGLFSVTEGKRKGRAVCLHIYMTIYQNYIPVYCFAIMSANRCCINPNDSILSMLQVQPVKIVVNSG